MLANRMRSSFVLINMLFNTTIILFRKWAGTFYNAASFISNVNCINITYRKNYKAYSSRYYLSKPFARNILHKKGILL